MPSGTLAQQLASERERCFVGRERALERLLALLTPEASAHIAYVHGPGGIGKSTLLQRFASLARQRGAQAWVVDCAQLPPQPIAIDGALREQGFAPSAGRHLRDVLILDGFEHAQGLDGWLRERFLPALPLECAFVFAGRRRLDPRWHVDRGWRALMRDIELDNLSEEHTARLVARLGVEEPRQRSVYAVTNGYPLAVALVSDVVRDGGDVARDLRDVPDLVETLLAQIVRDLPDGAHRRALYACATARAMTEGLLAAMLEDDERATALFEWLRERSFVATTRAGLVPHDLVRRVVLADLEWRSPALARDLRERARAYHLERLGDPNAAAGQILHDIAFVLRGEQPHIHGGPDGVREACVTRAVSPDDYPAIEAMTRAHEGDDSVRALRRWWGHQAAETVAICDAQGALRGFMMTLWLERVTPKEAEADPGTRRLYRYVREQGGATGTARAMFHRLYLSDEGQPAGGPVITQVHMRSTELALMTPGLAWGFSYSHDVSEVAWMYEEGPMQRLESCDFEVGGRRYGVIGCDFRTMTRQAWFKRFFDRTTAPQVSVPVDRDAFDESVKGALKALGREDLLRESMLVTAGMVAGDSLAARAERLGTVLRSACTAFADSPRGEDHHRVLVRTYLGPPEKQAAIADELHLSYGTYRRHLAAATKRVCDLLWERVRRGPLR